MNNLIKTANSVVVNPTTTSEVSNPNTPIHNDLTIFYLMLVEELKNYSDNRYNMLMESKDVLSSNIESMKNAKKTITDGIKRERDNFKRLGFENATSERIERYKKALSNLDEKLNNEHDKRVDVLKEIDKIKDIAILKEILSRVKKDFGEETLFVRYDDFEKVINKYDLVCGRLSDYKGVLPAHKMADIERVLNMQIPNFWKDKISRLFNCYEAFHRHDFDKIDLRFPFYTKNNEPCEAWYSFIKGYTFFIAAPAHEMMTEKELREKAIAEQRARDPFICAHTKWGIIIFTKWGEEAEDAIIKKYEN